MPLNITDYLKTRQSEVDRFLDAQIPSSRTSPAVLYEAIRYSLLAGGKRIRPILTIAAAEALNAMPPKGLLPVACAFELIHTYSLIHDDLPAMDNDDYRRGKLTNHKVYGDAVAVLAGDGLQTLAFEFCSSPQLMDGIDPCRQVQIVYELAMGAGNQGMVGGQVLDILAENQEVNLGGLQNIHAHKTGKLIRAAVRAGAILSGATAAQLAALTGYSEDIGLAFQIADDVLNVTGTREELGKNANTDSKRGKQTYPALYGLEGAQALAQECIDRAIGRLRMFDDKAEPLRGIAQFIVSRRN